MYSYIRLECDFHVIVYFVAQNNFISYSESKLFSVNSVKQLFFCTNSQCLRNDCTL